MRIAVGMSGGVDSSVAAALLARNGHEVVGLTMTLWRDGCYAGGSRDACFGPGEAEDLERARGVCRVLGIPHHAIDCADAYERLVLDSFRAESIAGRTPNPCVRCNSLVKFGALLTLAREAGIAFDAFATGHYARTGESGGRRTISMAADWSKDQSYFLYRLSQTQLAGLMFPLGNHTKKEARAMARDFGLATADQPDSQDFYSGELSDLFRVPDCPGPIVDENGMILGEHRGHWHYTIGQRHGLAIKGPKGSNARPRLYVVARDPERNAVVVGPADSLRCVGIEVDQVCWLSIPEPSGPLEAEVRVRSGAQPVPAMLAPMDKGRWHARFQGAVNAATPGQSAVFYREALLLGGGRIRSTDSE